MWPSCWIVVCLCGAASLVAADTDVSTFMKHLEVIPDLIDVGPQDFLNVTYMGSIKADKGVELQSMQVREKPDVFYPAAKGKYHTLLLVDLDAPSRNSRTLKEYLHWLVVNIPSNELSKGEERAAYVGAMPDENSGEHRLVFLLYRQPELIKFDFPNLSKQDVTGRPKFNTKEFAKQYKLGAPLAGNFFTATWSTDVAKLLLSQAKGESHTFR